MRHATKAPSGRDRRKSHGRSDGLIVGAMLCAAVMVAILALHGGPNLLGEQFDPGIITAPAR